jgi:hypothetical protein
MVDGVGDAAARERVLTGIEPREAPGRHALLRDLFAAEVEERDANGADEYFENLFWCAFLLHLVGDPSDVPMMWRAKHLDFDAACRFDVQFMLGAGVERTLGYLRANGHDDIAEALAEHPDLHDDLAEWAEFQRGYFYPRDA